MFERKNRKISNLSGEKQYNCTCKEYKCVILNRYHCYKIHKMYSWIKGYYLKLC